MFTGGSFSISVGEKDLVEDLVVEDLHNHPYLSRENEDKLEFLLLPHKMHMLLMQLL